MIKELSLNRTEIEESLKKALYNNIMATYLLLTRTGGIYNNRILFRQASVDSNRTNKAILLYSNDQIKINNYTIIFINNNYNNDIKKILFLN
jgi:hypothetical protein